MSHFSAMPVQTPKGGLMQVLSSERVLSRGWPRDLQRSLPTWNYSVTPPVYKIIDLQESQSSVLAIF